jgi:gamma-glutamylputrescine oxidase
MISYWEKTQLLKNPDFAIIGSGIVGLSTALEIRDREPNASISIFERGPLPWGASTKNAGFACFGSPSELLSDLDKSTENEVFRLVEKRFLGLQKLIKRCGSETIDYYNWGSNEVFLEEHSTIYSKCIENLDRLNALIYPITDENVYELNDHSLTNYGFNKVQHLIKNKGEGQINTGKMMAKLLALVKEKNISVFNGIELLHFEENNAHVYLQFSDTINLQCKTLVIATNGFAKKILPQLDVHPARAQVLITQPINDLKVKGTFHFDEGYYYFRNIENRVLFGGGRNLNFDGEKTTSIEVTQQIQNQLQQYLKELILPNTSYEIDYSWAGIMGIGNDKTPILKKISSNVFCGVKMGGMGVAIGSMIGKEISDLIFEIKS